MHYQSNNTGIRLRHLRTVDDIGALHDHVTASTHATARGFADLVLPNPVSATIKSPASATILYRFLRPSEPGYFSAVEAAEAFEGIGAGLPPDWEWLRRPLADVARLCRDLASNQQPERNRAELSDGRACRHLPDLIADREIPPAQAAAFAFVARKRPRREAFGPVEGRRFEGLHIR